MKRALWIGLGVVVVASGAGLWWLYSSLDGLVARAVETYGSAALGTEVSVGSVEIAPREGRGTIRGLRVANPEGFSANDVMRFEELTLALEPGSVFESPVVVSTVRLVDPRVRFEVDAAGRSNLQVLQKNVSAYAPASDPAAEPPDASADGTGGEPLRLRIDVVAMEKGQAEADLRAVGDEERLLELRSFRLTDLGGRDGAPPPELAKQFARQLTEQLARGVALARASSAIQDKAGELLKDQPEAAEAVRGLLDRFGGDASDDDSER